MKVYMVFGEAYNDCDDKCVTFIYGVFNDRVVAEEHKNKLEDALERDGSNERIYVRNLELNEPTRAYYDTLEG